MDAISDDKNFAITIIAFIGSVFSPYYAWSGRASPLNHCAVNVALYGKRGARWAMTERGAGHIARTADTLTIGPSHLRWDNGALIITVHELCAPIPKPVRGTITIKPNGCPATAFMLDRQGRHFWQPVAPQCRVDVDLQAPELQWSGSGYHDANFGTEPLESGFRAWTWSRAQRADDAVVFYDAERRDGSHQSLALKFNAGSIQALQPQPLHKLPGTAWGMTRTTRADKDQTPRVISTLESAPFYTRSILRASVEGETTDIVHESLSLDRVQSAWVRALLPFRMPRALF
jgi:carotenoid 1,2-hydratase